MQAIAVVQHTVEALLWGVSQLYQSTTEMVLHDLNLFLKAGECVALVGHNGAGKTTLVKLLTRLYEPMAGKILLDGVCH
jgi:ATP-binding cassette subfamily B protein